MFYKILISMADIEFFSFLKKKKIYIYICFVKWDNDFSFMYNLDFFGICRVLYFQKYLQCSHSFGLAVFKGFFLEQPLSLLCQLCATLSWCYDCFLLRGKFLFHQYGCTVFTHCKCCVAVSVILLGPVSDE